MKFSLTFTCLALQTQVWKARPEFPGSLKPTGKIWGKLNLKEEQKRVKNLRALWLAGNFNSSYSLTKAAEKTCSLVEKAIKISDFI